MASPVPPQVQWNERRRCWEARKYLCTDRLTGKPVKPSFTSRERERGDAQAACDEWWGGVYLEHVRAQGSRLEQGSRTTVAAAVGDWIDNALAVSGAAGSTVERYRGSLRRYVCRKPGGIGGYMLDELDADTVTRWYALLLREGGRDGAPLSAATVRNAAAMMQAAYAHFVKDGLVLSNPFEQADKPRARFMRAEVFERDELASLLEWCRGALADGSAGLMQRNLAAAVALAAWLGLRAGECCALQRRDLNRVLMQCHVPGSVPNVGRLAVKPTKGGKARQVAVPPALFDLLDAHFAWQDAHLGAIGGSRAPVVCGRGGSLVRPYRISRAFAKLRDELGLPKGTHFHTLRHTNVTAMLESGVSVFSAQQRSGHSTPGYMIDHYGHALKGADEDAAARISGYMEGM